MSTPLRYEDITETAGMPLSAEAAEMLYTRYAWARDAAADRRVLELGCGAGVGLGLIALRARAVTGGDYSTALLRDAQAHYGERFPLIRLSAEALPFKAGSFDLVVFFEATYYVPDMRHALAEIARVLTPGGGVLFANANPERPDFIRSPHSTHYHTADEFRTALGALGFAVSVAGAFPVMPSDCSAIGHVRAAGLAWARRTLQRLGLVPRTLKGRARLKRLMYWRLRATPAELHEGFAPAAVFETVASGPVRQYKVIYVRGVRPPFGAAP